MNNISFDKYSYIINGRRHIIRAGAVHYFRLPGEKLWIDRLSKLKYSGYNTIDMYLCWGYHSKAPGEYDFSGIKDVNRLMKIAEDLGLFLVARPGPYINAELSAGGLPGWLLAKKDAILRNRKNNDFIYSRVYMDAAKEWYEQIIPRINECKNVIAVQVENEYYTNEMEEDYIKELVDLVRSLGCTLPLSHNDMYNAGLYANIVDIYGVDTYSVTYFHEPWQSFPEIFALLDSLEETIRYHAPESPMYIAELQAGWFDKWGGIGYDAMRSALGPEHLDIVTKTSLGQGVTIFTHYMGAGGTNWDHLASTEVYTSYDFASPITEYGLPTDRLVTARNLNNFLAAFDITKTELAENQPEIKTDNPSATVLYRLRQNLKDNSKWLFIRNDNIGPERFIVNNDYTIEMSPHEMLILPIDLSINDLKINYSTLQFLAGIRDQNHQIIIVQTTHSGEINITIPDAFEVKVPELNKNVTIENNKDSFTLSYNNKPEFIEPIIIKIDIEDYTTRFIFLPPSMLNSIHQLEDQIILGPAYITTVNGNPYMATKKQTAVTYVGLSGIKETKLISSVEKQDCIPLCKWELSKLGKEIGSPNSVTGWVKACEYLDSDFNGLYEGFFWYKTSYNSKLDTITLDIRHCFAVYLNGQEIFSFDSFKSVSGEDEPDPVTIDIPADIQKDENSLILLIQSLGHNKGFEDDAANPRGLLNYSTSPKIELEWYLKQALSTEEIANVSDKNVERSDKLVCAQGQFAFTKPDNHDVPLGLVLTNVPFNKANIYLNDILVGHYWGDKGPQTKFFLPDAFYNSDGQLNSIKLVVWYRSVDKTRNYPTDLNNANIYLEPFGNYKLTAV